MGTAWRDCGTGHVVISWSILDLPFAPCAGELSRLHSRIYRVNVPSCDVEIVDLPSAFGARSDSRRSRVRLPLRTPLEFYYF